MNGICQSQTISKLSLFFEYLQFKGDIEQRIFFKSDQIELESVQSKP